MEARGSRGPCTWEDGGKGFLAPPSAGKVVAVVPTQSCLAAGPQPLCLWTWASVPWSSSPGQLCGLRFASDERSALPPRLSTWNLPPAPHWLFRALLRPHGVVGIWDCISLEGSLQVPPPSAGPWLCICVGAFLDSEGMMAGLGVLLRAGGPQASALRPRSRIRSGPVLGASLQAPELPGLILELVFGVTVPVAAVCGIINLHLLAGSGGAAVSACGLRVRDRPKEAREAGVLSLSHSSPNAS